MSKANTFLTKDEVKPQEPQTKKEAAQMKRALTYVVGACFFVSMFLVGPASAEINTTAIIQAINAFVEIIPGITGMITAVVPAIMTLAIVGFVLRFFNEIIGMISSVLKF